MNLNVLKNFAPFVRRQLIEAVGRKLDFILTVDTPDLRDKATQRSSIKRKAEKDRLGLVERVSYTWFNRLAALRFLDARGWHPFLCRVLTPVNAGETQPEVLKLARNGALPVELAPFADTSRINDLLDGRIPSTDPQGEVYRHLILAACRYYHDLIPFLFEALDDETELLMPDDLLTEHSAAQGFRSAINDEDCTEVEIIGWLYQFYITEKKDQVMARKSAVPTEDIPAVTQLFTPHWIVRYLVENSLGRLWLLNRPGSKLREHMPYYIEGESETDFIKITKPEEISLLDPASGSGHMLTYSFELLSLIYEEEGHAPSEIPNLILRHNLFGLEICPRATQLAQFALVCKAREKSRLAFRNSIQPQVMCLEDVDITPEEMTDYLHLPNLRELFTENVLRQVHQFRENTSTFGSLIKPVLTAEEIIELQASLSSVNVNDDFLLLQIHHKVLLALNQALMLSQRYKVVVVNPPYMKGTQMPRELKALTEEEYSDGKANLFACFIERASLFPVVGGLVGMITLHGWMFTVRYEALRIKILKKFFIPCVAHLGAHAFDTIGGEVVQTAMFVLRTNLPSDMVTVFHRLVLEKNETEKRAGLLERRCEYRINARSFLSIEGAPMVFWLPDQSRKAFTSFQPLVNRATIRAGLQTGDNDLFLRYWHEVDFMKVGLKFSNREAAKNSGCKWFPHNKGGGFRKWYGLQEYLIDWFDDGASIKQQKKDDLEARKITPNNSKCWNQDYYFHAGFSWSALTTGSMSARDNGDGFLFDTKGQTVFPSSMVDHPVVLGFLNSKISTHFLEALSPTLDFNGGTVGKLPVPELSDNFLLSEYVAEAVIIARTDWDNFEVSWDFHDLPLLRLGLRRKTLGQSWEAWANYCNQAIARMQVLETENNRIWIDAYSLKKELTPEVPEEEITLARPDQRKDIVSFLSYAVGCMMGRYSLDHPGLILANDGDTLENYRYHVSKRRGPLDLRTALAEPLSVVLRDDASPKCFCCGKIISVSDAWFILADIYDRPEAQICGRPMIYCKDCLNEKERQISLSRRLCDFSLHESINKKWSDPETLGTFLELVGCFEQKIPVELEDLTFMPDEDGILPVLNGEWFEDDIVARTHDFLRATFGEDTFEENLRFIEESLGKDLRKYFLNDFYKDHLQTYKKRPIYWLFQSPKKGFSALIYLHRCTRDTINVLLNRYLRDYMHKLHSRIEHLEHIQSNSGSSREKTAARKESDTLKKTLRECEEYEREIILPLAQQRIELDLDDGVKVNYLKFGKALAPIPGLAVKEEEG